MSFATAMPFLGIYLTDVKASSRKGYLYRIFAGAFSVVVKKKKIASNSNVHQYTNQRLNKVWYIHNMKIYAAIKRTAFGLYFLTEVMVMIYC